ncbi:MAG: extracellular solute-binding protein [Chloroflexi bacterium]|nr:extracellular solute-binding protein [Chloroflexota bacterium]
MIVSPGVKRRTFLRLCAAGSVGLSALLEACGASIPIAPAAPTSTSRAGAATASGAGSPSLPTYAPIQGPKPDLAGNEDGLQDGYFTYPKNPFKSVTQTPGLGTDVTAMTRDAGGPPPPLDQNAAWQAVNKQLNANMKLQIISPADYQARVATVMAGGEPPDLMYFMTGTQVTPGLPEYLKASFADLGPYLAGDAVKDYPNLAGLPPSSWKLTRYNNSIYGIPLPRPSVDNIWFTNQTRFDVLGLTQPENKDDFKRVLIALTRPQMNQYGLGDSSSTLGLALIGRGDCPMAAMFGVPNNWAVDSSGKFTKDFETEQFKAALDFVRDLYASGVYYPDPLNGVTIKSSFLAGRYGVMLQGWSPYPLEFWNIGKTQNPPMEVRTLAPFSHDGGTPAFHRYGLNLGMTAIKKGSPERVKELLRIMNYLAAPFGSEESLLLDYGVKDDDFTFDAQGNPVPTTKGLSDLFVSWKYFTQHQQVLFDASDSSFASVAHTAQQGIVPYLVADPSVGLFSATDTSKGGVLNMKVVDGLAEMVTGRAPVSGLGQLIQDWRAGGGDQIRTEFQQAYADSTK